MGFDLTKWLTNEKLEDHVGRPIVNNIQGLSDKYDVRVTIEVFKKKKEDK